MGMRMGVSSFAGPPIISLFVSLDFAKARPMAPTRAIVRPPGRTYPDALTQLSPRPEVDLPLARRQHEGYVATLRHVGLIVTVLPPDDEHPDAVFVQDRVCVVDGLAIVSRSAVPSREGEAGPIVEVLGGLYPVFELPPPAYLDWGDVLVTEDALYVGLSERSNREAVDALRRRLAPCRRVEGVPVPAGLLHLLSGCAYLGGRKLLALASLEDFARSRGFEVVPVAESEPLAANVLAFGRRVVVPAGYPETTRRLERAGFTVQRIAVSEFEKRDGGVTCLSVLY
jgi:dimethylargininase